MVPEAATVLRVMDPARGLTPLSRSRGERRLIEAREAPDPALPSAAGFALLELLVGLGISAILLASLLLMLYSAQANHEDFGDSSATRQTARLAMMQIQRDLARAGVGLTPMKPVFPSIVPQRGGGVLIRMNPAATTTFLTDDMNEHRRLEVDSTAAFPAGTRIAVYDAFGSIDFAEVRRVFRNRSRLLLDRPLSKRYQRDDGTAVVRFEEIAYGVQDIDSVPTLVRMVGETVQPLAPNVMRLSVTYFDNSSPPVSFQPDEPEEQANIRAVEIELVLLTENERLDLGERERVRIRTRVAPRSLMIS